MIPQRQQTAQMSTLELNCTHGEMNYAQQKTVKQLR